MPRTSLYHLAVQEFQRRYLLSELTRNNWNRFKTARDLGLSYRALLYKISQLNLRPRTEEDEVEARPASA